MEQGTARVNPSEETIKIGPLGIRFLLTGDDSNGSASVFEVLVPVRQKLTAPAHIGRAHSPPLHYRLDTERAAEWSAQQLVPAHEHAWADFSYLPPAVEQLRVVQLLRRVFAAELRVRWPAVNVRGRKEGTSP